MSANQRFYDRAEGQLVTVEIVFTAARQSFQSSEAAAKLKSSDDADVKVPIEMIPKDLGKAYRAVKKHIEIGMRKYGWSISVRGAKAVWLVPAHMLNDVLQLLAEFPQLKSDAIEPFVKDWDAFKDQCLAKAGNFTVPDHAFPYHNAAEYIDAFKADISVESKSLNKLDNLPTEVIDVLMDSSHKQLDLMLDNIRNDLRRECMSLFDRVGGDISVTKATFNELNRMCEVAVSVVGDACPVVNKLCGGFPGFIARYDGNYKKFGPVNDNDKFDRVECDKLLQTLQSTAKDLHDSMLYDPVDV